MNAQPTLHIDLIRPNPGQPRRHFDEEALAELADSIRAVGVLEPIVVRPVDDVPGWYQIVAGERRWRAAQVAGLVRVPVIIREDLTDDMAFELSLIENILREDMNPVEEAEGFDHLIGAGLDVETIAARTGKRPGSIRARLALLGLDAPILKLVRDGQVDAYDAGHLSRLSIEGQHRAIRAMNAGVLTKPGDLARLCGSLYAQESQAPMFGEDDVETLPSEVVRAQHDLRDDLAHASDMIVNAHKRIDEGALRGCDAEVIATLAEALAKEARRIAHRAHVARVEAADQQLTIGGKAA